jgi:hypothetical protein
MVWRQGGTAVLISYVAALFTPIIYFKGVHELLRKFTPSAAPRFGGATALCFATGLCYSVVAILLLNMNRSGVVSELNPYPQCVRSKKQIPYSDGLPFKRRRQPACVHVNDWRAEPECV